MATATMDNNGQVRVHPETSHPQIGDFLVPHRDTKIGWVFIGGNGGMERCITLEDGTITIGDQQMPITVQVTGRCLTGPCGNKLAANITDISSGQISKCHLQIHNIERI